jgi:hypothetical protein
MLGPGSRGKKIGLLEGQLLPGAKGWQGASPGSALADRIDSYRKRLASNEERLTTATDERAKHRAERQVAFYKKEIERLTTELEAATAPREAPANTFTTTLESLGKSIDDHAGTLALVEACNAELEQKGLVQEKEPPKRVDLPAGVLPGRQRIERGLTGGPGTPTLGVKAGPLAPPSTQPLEQPPATGDKTASSGGGE